MKRKFWKQFVRQVFFFSTLCLIAISCKDEYLYDNKEPDWLGASIYDYLKGNGKYTIYSNLIDDVGYTEVLRKTGSKTIFVANDSAFEKFFKDNPWGIGSYNELTLAQKKLILNYSMIDNAYLIETLSNYNSGGALVIGEAMRRSTSLSVLDTVPFLKGDDLPDGKYWTKYKTRGLYLVQNENMTIKRPLVYFLQKMLDNAGITDDDFSIITGISRNKNDAYVFKNKIITRDIICKNGYVNVMDNILVPPMNMAEYIRTNPNTSVFSSLLNRFCAPYYYEELTTAYKQINPGFTDSVFVKGFYTVSNGGGANVYPGGGGMIQDVLLLPFDPGWSTYHYPTVALQADMAAMFVPTNEALDYYFNSGRGKLLKERYGTWDNVPDNIIILLLKRHMRRSFLESVPSRFDKMNDSENFPVPAKKSDIVSTYLSPNGLVYSINNVYGPVDYESVYAPILFSTKTKIFNWAIIQNDFKLYLNSLVSQYSFFVPTDENLSKCIDPFTIGKDIPGALKFWYNDKTNSVNATIYKYNKATNTLGDSVGVVTSSSLIANRLLDLLDNHIVVGNVESGQKYYVTKGGNILQVEGSGSGLTAKGGGDVVFGEKANVVNIYHQTNGNTYLIDKPIQTPIKSAYNVLSTTPEFSEFFSLLNGFPSSSNSVVFVRKDNFCGIDFNVKFFNTFNYTIYVPTNTAIQEAITNGIITPWETRGGITGINDMTDLTKQNAAIFKLERFLRYHFQDNSVFVSGNSVNEVYTTATIKDDNLDTKFNTFINKYYKVGITGNGDGLLLTTEKNETANVLTQGGLYNIITRDYIFNHDPSTFKEIDGSGNVATGREYNTSVIYTSSTAVIHQIDKILQFE